MEDDVAAAHASRAFERGQAGRVSTPRRCHPLGSTSPQLCRTWNTMSPPSSMTAGRMRVSSSSLIMATTSLSSSLMAVSLCADAGSVNSGSPARAHRHCQIGCPGTTSLHIPL